MSHLSIKLLSPHQNQERNMHRSSIIYKKTIQRSSKQICWWICIREDNRYGLFFPGNVLLWIIHYWYVKTSWWICFSQTHSFSLHKMLIDGLEWCGLLVNYCDVLSAVWTHSDGTHSLQRIHWSASYIMLNVSKSILTKKQAHLDLYGWIEVDYIFNK